MNKNQPYNKLFDSQNVDDLFSLLLSTLKKNKAIIDKDIEIITEAFFLAQKAHSKQLRKSGEPYITHPLHVAHILADMELDPKTITASLLHDILEDSDITKEKLEKLFGHKIVSLVEGVSHLGKISFPSKAVHRAENFRKMFLAMAADIRVILIKMADRLHNMRTLEFLSKQQQHDISLETLEIYTPLAHRLGMAKIKWELEDLCFRFLDFENFQKMKKLVAEKRQERERYLEKFIKNIYEELNKTKIRATISGRPKHFYSIYQKMINQKLEYKDVYDLLAIRIIVEELSQCYAVIGVIHAKYKPVPGKFKDYIAMPKNNMYQSLHTTIIGNEGRPVEIQVRTTKMHAVNENGLAAHWKYKEGNLQKTSSEFDKKLTWLKQLIEWQKELKDSKEFMDNLKLELFVDTVFVFTPKGDVHELQKNSTPVDFAYHIHTEVGHRCIGAKVNGQIASLNHTLKNGDIVEIFTGKEDKPKRDWLDFVISRQAKSKIKTWLRKQEEQASIDNQPTKTVLEDKQKSTATKKISPQTKKDSMASSTPSDVIIPGASNVLFHFAKCCHPIPPDDIIGIVTKMHGISIHRANCTNISHKSNKIDLYWHHETTGKYLSKIEIKAYDKAGFFSDLTGIISATHVNIKSANIHTQKDINSVLSEVVIEIKNEKDLNKVIHTVRQIKTVYSVSRI